MMNISMLTRQVRSATTIDSSFHAKHQLRRPRNITDNKCFTLFQAGVFLDQETAFMQGKWQSNE
jgi:hypothetical protein